MNALLTSCHIPFYFNGSWMTEFRGRWVQAAVWGRGRGRRAYTQRGIAGRVETGAWRLPRTRHAA